MGGLLTSFELHLVYLAVGALGGVFLGPRVKDWVLGVPGELRGALKSAETAAVARMRAEATKVVAELKAAVQVPVPVPPPPTA